MTGLIYAFTGDGKGKTSAALGVATRALLLGKRVGWVAFYKGKDWMTAEKRMTGKFSNLEMYFEGKGFRINNKNKIANIVAGQVVVDKASEDEHKEAVRRGIEVASEILNRKSSDHSPKIAPACAGRQGSELGKQRSFLLVMDEVLNAVSEGLIEEKEVLEVLKRRGETHVVLTGRGGEPTRRLLVGLLAGADLVTECKKIKHPYDKGRLAVAGLDY